MRCAFVHLCLFFPPFFSTTPRVKPKSWSWRTCGPRITPATRARCPSAMSAASLTNPSPSSSQIPQVRGDTEGPHSPPPPCLLNSHYPCRRGTQHPVQGLEHLTFMYMAAGITNTSCRSFVAGDALVSCSSAYSQCLGQPCHEIIKTNYV